MKLLELSGWEAEVMVWKVFVAFFCGMRLAAHVATIRRRTSNEAVDTQE